MKVTATILASLATAAVASPVALPGTSMAKRQVFTDLTCKLSKAVTPGTPLLPLFPTAVELGTIVGPTLKFLIGEETLEKIDATADTLCINSQQEPAGERGVCAEALQAVRDMADAILRVDQAHKYRCLLNLLCVAHAGTTQGTCQYLLAGADCVANRIIQAKDLECTKSI